MMVEEVRSEPEVIDVVRLASLGVLIYQKPITTS
jgi:hypothetical protein